MSEQELLELAAEACGFRHYKYMPTHEGLKILKGPKSPFGWMFRPHTNPAHSRQMQMNLGIALRFERHSLGLIKVTASHPGDADNIPIEKSTYFATEAQGTYHTCQVVLDVAAALGVKYLTNKD